MAISLNDIYTEARLYVINHVVGSISDPAPLERRKINPGEEFAFDITVSNGIQTPIEGGESSTETDVLVGVPIKNVYLELIADERFADLIVPSAPIVASEAIGGQVLVPGTKVKTMFIHLNDLGSGKHEIKQLKGKTKDIDIPNDISIKIAVFIYAEVDLFPHTRSKPSQTSFTVYCT